MNYHDVIRPECEHRITAIETLIRTMLENHLPHLEKRLDRIEKMLWGIVTAAVGGIVGLIIFIIKGHIQF